MGATDNFCLRWNDFESNISSGFRELRDAEELCDVTLCCDNGNDLVQAHKLILAACSPLFRRIFLQNRNQHSPFLYLKGVHKDELVSILNFMYYGEVNIAQESLNKFLLSAEELEVKGLTTDETCHKPETSTPDDTTRKKSSKKNFHTKAQPKRKIDSDQTIDLSCGLDLKRIKAEPELLEGEDSNEQQGDDFDDQDDFNQYAVEPGTSGGSQVTADLAEARFSRTRFGNALLIDPLGYTYSMNRKKSKRIYWVCNANKKLHCRGSAITEGFCIVKSAGMEGHTHTPTPSLRHAFAMSEEIDSNQESFLHHEDDE